MKSKFYSAAVFTVSTWMLSAGAFAAKPAAPLKSPILTDPKILETLKIPALQKDVLTHVAYAEVTAAEQSKIQKLAHKWNRCGGFELLDARVMQPKAFQALIQPMRSQKLTSKNFLALKPLTLEKSDAITKAVEQIDENRVKDTVTFLSAFPDRYNKGDEPNKAINAFRSKVEALYNDAKQNQVWTQSSVQISLVDHVKTAQKSIHAVIKGRERPNEIVVIGGHIDSISFDGDAPGADDNASGSADLLEAFRILLSQKQAPARTIEIFWYAGEESGLLGSSEIAKSYKEASKNVIGVLQLDMTLFPGSGELVFSSMTDFTSASLRDYLVEINRLYVGARIVEDQCGYGCSDHASWNRQGYPAVIPFEATFDDMNHNLHTSADRIDSHSNFKHAAAFGKLTLAFAMDLSESTWKPAN